ncbi:putative cog1565 domain protein [Venturia nashicola]|nr:putative cog1565 domain protein [Venturia nashicola]
MDSPLVSRIFRRLLSHDTCSRLRTRPPIRACQHQRALTGTARREERPRDKKYGVKPTDQNEWQQRSDVVFNDKSADYKRYPMVTADELRDRKERPKRVKMLMRDFVEDSLYNPHYGYFSKQAVIFSPGEPFDFPNIKDEPDFYKQLGYRYSEFEDKLDEKEVNETRQLWHTPTELFRPHYGEAMARYMVTNYKLSLYPYYDLLIYEMGAGNGTMMLNILDHIRDNHPEVYERTKYKIIEISTNLAGLQAQQLKQNIFSRGHMDKVEIINRSIFDWNTYVSSPCFFLALEVFDNFAHDVIRYDPITEQPLQGTVLIDNQGEMHDIYDRQLDTVAQRFLKVRELSARQPYTSPISGPKVLRNLRQALPGAPNLTVPEYIPTRLMQFFDILHNYFPAHRILSSDFHKLPQAVKGINAPVVQTRYKRRTIAVSTALVQQGYFDILFPTDFRVMEDMYRAITGKFTKVLTHEDFLSKWAYLEDTRCGSGENPLVGWYRNASVLITV